MVKIIAFKNEGRKKKKRKKKRSFSCTVAGVKVGKRSSVERSC